REHPRRAVGDRDPPEPHEGAHERVDQRREEQPARGAKREALTGDDARQVAHAVASHRSRVKASVTATSVQTAIAATSGGINYRLTLPACTSSAVRCIPDLHLTTRTLTYSTGFPHEKAPPDLPWC